MHLLRTKIAWSLICLIPDEGIWQSKSEKECSVLLIDIQSGWIHCSPLAYFSSQTITIYLLCLHYLCYKIEILQ